jgi:hypothetical protein
MLGWTQRTVSYTQSPGCTIYDTYPVACYVPSTIVTYCRQNQQQATTAGLGLMDGLVTSMVLTTSHYTPIRTFLLLALSSCTALHCTLRRASRPAAHGAVAGLLVLLFCCCCRLRVLTLSVDAAAYADRCTAQKLPRG